MCGSRFPAIPHACRTSSPLLLHDRRFFMSQISSTQNSKGNLYSLVLCAILIALSLSSVWSRSFRCLTAARSRCSVCWQRPLPATSATEMGLTSGVALGLLNLIIDPVILFPDAGASRLCFGVRAVWGFPDFSAIRKTAVHRLHRCDHRQIYLFLPLRFPLLR